MNTIQTVDESKLVLKDIPELKISSQLDYERVISFRIQVKEREKLINETFDPIVKKNHEAWKQSIATRDRFIKPIVEIIDNIDSNIKTWKRECERKAQEQQEKIRREAEDKAKKEQERLNARAEKWSEKGNDTKAEELREKANQVEPLVATVSPSFQKIKGDTTRKSWKFRITDFSKLSDTYKIPNESLLGTLARSGKGKVKLDGVEFFEE